jgi:hypothetical protein
MDAKGTWAAATIQDGGVYDAADRTCFWSDCCWRMRGTEARHTD